MRNSSKNEAWKRKSSEKNSSLSDSILERPNILHCYFHIKITK